MTQIEETLAHELVAPLPLTAESDKYLVCFGSTAILFSTSKPDLDISFASQTKMETYPNS